MKPLTTRQKLMILGYTVLFVLLLILGSLARLYMKYGKITETDIWIAVAFHTGVFSAVYIAVVIVRPMIMEVRPRDEDGTK